jgi:CubicO group peptidase (beta-lactamase class C family)
MSSSKNLEEMEWESIERQIVKLLQKSKVPGMSVSVLKDNEIIYTRSFGVRNLENNLPVTSDTLFGIGSCTKVITCIAIMQLAERGLISIDDPVKNHIPFKIGLEDKPILIRHLMSHSSGIPNLGTASVLISRLAPFDETWVPFATKEDAYLHINSAQDEIADEPGKRYFYFNGGYLLLGEIIEAISGLSFSEYVEENILKPMKMTRSTFHKEEFEKDENRMTAYYQKKDEPVEKSHPFDQFIHAAGGLLTSTNEFSNLISMLLNKGKFEDKQILSSESVDKMFSIEIELPRGFFGRIGYGFGLAITEDFLGERKIDHGGSTAVSSAYFSFIPKLGLGVITAANVGNSPGGSICWRILSMLIGKNPEDSVLYIQIQDKMELLPGDYEGYKGLSKVKVFIENGLLYVQTSWLGTTSKYALIPEDDELKELNFYIYNFGNKTPVKFEFKENNNVDLFIERNCFHRII